MKPAGIAVGVAAATGTTVVAATMPWPEIFKGILGAGGIPPAIFLLIVGGLVVAVVAIAYALRKEQTARDEEREGYAKQLNDLQEKRHTDTREMLLALERTGTALTTHTVALEARTVTLNELVRGVDNFSRNQEENRRYFEALGQRLEAGIAKTLDVVKHA